MALPISFSAAKIFQDKFDVTLLHTKPEVAAQERMVDDGNGKVEVSPVRAALGLWVVSAAEEGSPFCMLLSPLHISTYCPRGMELAVHPQCFRTVRHFPQWCIIWKIRSSHL